MERRQLGETGVEVSRIILGCGNFGGIGSAPEFFGQGESEEEAFRIMDAEGEALLRGKVVRIEERDLVFKVDEKLYSIHVGQNLEDALKKPLNTEQMKEMGLTVAADKTGGGQ